MQVVELQARQAQCDKLAKMLEKKLEESTKLKLQLQQMRLLLQQKDDMHLIKTEELKGQLAEAQLRATPAPAHPNEPATRPTTATGAAAAVNAPAPASNAPPPTAVAATLVASCTLTEDRRLGGSSKDTCFCGSCSACETTVQDARQACDASFRTARTRAS